MNDILHALLFIGLAGAVFLGVIAAEAYYWHRKGRPEMYSFKETLTNRSLTVVSPDTGGVVRARAFAKRGMGVGAVAPVRGSANHSGAIESTAVGGAIVIESVTLGDTGRSCDNDGILDDGELGVLTVKVRNTGTLPFSARATITTESEGLYFVGGRSITFPPVQPYGSATGKLVVALSSRTPQTLIDLKVSADAPGLAIPGAVTTQRRFLGNYDLAANSDSGDSMDDPAGWTQAGDPMLDASQPWSHVREGAEGRWSITDNAAPSDQSLVSPPLVISATGSFGMSLRHRYSFEADSLTSYDGGVIEISTDNGMTWTDTGKQLTSRGYNGTVWTQNVPLKSRQAFVGKSAGYPAYTTTEADFGTAYQGKTVRLRFRVGTDPSEGGPGWDLDEVRFTGVTNQPFSSRRANACRLR